MHKWKIKRYAIGYVHAIACTKDAFSKISVFSATQHQLGWWACNIIRLILASPGASTWLTSCGNIPSINVNHNHHGLKLPVIYQRCTIYRFHSLSEMCVWDPFVLYFPISIFDVYLINGSMWQCIWKWLLLSQVPPTYRITQSLHNDFSCSVLVHYTNQRCLVKSRSPLEYTKLQFPKSIYFFRRSSSSPHLMPRRCHLGARRNEINH